MIGLAHQIVVWELEKARTKGAKDKKPRKRGPSFQDTYYKHFHKIAKEGMKGLARISRLAEERAIVEFQNKGRHSKEFEKARTKGAKDKQPRKHGFHNVLTSSGYSKGIEHPKVHLYHKEGDLIMVNKKSGDWSHFNNEKGFVHAGSGHGTLKGYLNR